MYTQRVSKRVGPRRRLGGNGMMCGIALEAPQVISMRVLKAPNARGAAPRRLSIYRKSAGDHGPRHLLGTQDVLTLQVVAILSLVLFAGAVARRDRIAGSQSILQGHHRGRCHSD